MEPVVLRARATCPSCASPLPPRSEAWWDDATATATCDTCVRTLAAQARPAPGGGPGPRRGRTSVLVVERPEAPPAVLDRGDVGEGRVGQTLEGARVHGLEVLHGVVPAPGVAPVDHLVIAVNGLWLVHAEPALTGKLERRDLGDWFTADPRLHVGGHDRSDLVATVRAQVDATVELLGAAGHPDVAVRGVVCFGAAPAGWVSTPFTVASVGVTWRSELVEPMLAPVLLAPDERAEVTALLARASSPA